MKKAKLLLLIAATGMLSSCDLSQIPGLDKRLSYEDSKAVGAACRHSGRALEDCFALNPSTHQAGVFEGWRDMNDYMMANKLEVVKPEIEVSRFKPDEQKTENGTHGADGHSSSAGNAHSDTTAVDSERPRFDPGSLGKTPSSSSGRPGEQGHESSTPAPSARPWERPSRDGKNTT